MHEVLFFILASYGDSISHHPPASTNRDDHAILVKESVLTLVNGFARHYHACLTLNGREKTAQRRCQTLLEICNGVNVADRIALLVRLLFNDNAKAAMRL